MFLEGGNTYHLMEWLNKSGLAKLLPELLKDKVYVGVNAVKDMSEKIYALDDDSAIVIVDDKVEVISEGKWFVIN